jgi:phosphate transport system permease protein
VITRQNPRWGERAALLGLGIAGLTSIVVTVGIVVSLLSPAIDFFRTVPITDFITGTRWAPTFADPSYGVLPLITGTLWTTALALCVAVPFGLGIAIYLAEYAAPGVRRVLKPVIEILAGIPSVVFGYFALTFVTPVVLQGLFGIRVGTYSVLAAGLTLGVLIIPTVASLSEDAMSAVPQSLRHGSLALGANRMRTVLRVVFPAAVSGIAAATVLGISRAVGETMLVALAAGTQARLVDSPNDPGQTMTGFIAQTATGESVPGSVTYNALFAVGLTLFIITLIINIVSIALVQRFRERY